MKGWMDGWTNGWTTSGLQTPWLFIHSVITTVSPSFPSFLFLRPSNFPPTLSSPWTIIIGSQRWSVFIVLIKCRSLWNKFIWFSYLHILQRMLPGMKNSQIEQGIYAGWTPGTAWGRQETRWPWAQSQSQWPIGLQPQPQRGHSCWLPSPKKRSLSDSAQDGNLVNLQVKVRCHLFSEVLPNHQSKQPKDQKHNQEAELRTGGGRSPNNILKSCACLASWPYVVVK